MRIAAIIAAVLAIALLSWFLAFLRINRKRGEAFLDHLRLSWRAKILGFRWQSSCRLHAGLQVSSHSIRTAHVTIRLRPRAIPWKWLMAWYRSEGETLAIESDLETAPLFSLQVRNHRWSGRLGGPKSPKQGWRIHRPGPILVTTQDGWDQEQNPVLNALLAARQSEFTEVRFQPHSPHLSAELPLDRLADFAVSSEVLGTLRELAAEARAPKN